ncbi:hypothetical protein ACLI36_28350, partial [Pseudomonas aeruginosa]
PSAPTCHLAPSTLVCSFSFFVYLYRYLWHVLVPSRRQGQICIRGRRGTLLNEMGRRDAKKGLATLCIGGGQGVALTLARD